jgi:hypothetical protein
MDSLRQAMTGSIAYHYTAYQLSKRFVIDLAMQCRLESTREIKEFAIDDTTAIKKTLKYELELAGIPQDRQLHYAQLIEDYNAENFSENTWSSRQWLQGIEEYENYRKHHPAQSATPMGRYIRLEEAALRCYLRRDTAMAEQITLCVAGTGMPLGVPVVFIGGEHLKGIVDLLPRDVGWLYIDTHDHENYFDQGSGFDSLRVLGSRKRAMTRFGTGKGAQMKIPVSPLAEEWPLVRSGIRKINTEFGREAAGLEGPFDAATKQEILAAVRTNPALEGYRIEFGKGKLTIGDDGEGAFARISGNEIELFDDGHYSGNTARMNFIRNLSSPEYSYGRKALKFVDESGEVFETVSDPNSGTRYLAELGKGGADLHLFRPDLKVRATLFEWYRPQIIYVKN